MIRARRPARLLCVLASIFILVGVAGMVVRSGGAASGDVGFRDQAFTGAGTAPSGSKPESKLWWNDGYWWGVLWDAQSQDFHIFKLDLATQSWIDTGVTVDDRAGTRADVLWDGAHLYVASHVFSTSPASGYPSRLYRYSYDASIKTYSLDAGFPAVINNYRTETLVIDKASAGRLWATWMQNSQVYVNRTTTDDRVWGVPFVVPVAGTTATSDDISSVVSFGGNKIGVMWSNQLDSAMHFAVHVDGQPDTTWEPSRTAIQGPNEADDHINLKSLQADGTGRVFAAVKTSLNDLPNPNPNAPLIMLLVRDATTGDWSSHVFGRVSEDHTRPIVLLDEQNGVVHMFATAPVTGGTIYEKTSPLSTISFASGLGTPFVRDAASAGMNNATSTKQNVNRTTGLVVLATNDATGYYWHNYESLQLTAPPKADFTAVPTTGGAPLAVSFTDLSTGSPTSWSWTFGDGAGSTAENPTHTYTAVGTYTVTLTVSNAAGTDTKTAFDYISVTPPPPDFSVAASPSTQTVVRQGSTSYTVDVAPANGFSGPVTLNVSGLPQGATGRFSPNPVTLPPTASSILSVTTTATTKVGSSTLVITGSSGTLAHSTKVTLQVKRK